MPNPLPKDDAFRAAHYLKRARREGSCLCLGNGAYRPVWHGVGRKTERIARLICRVTHGPPPAGGAMAMHSCDNIACINPEHISWGTQSQNLKDAVQKGRRRVPTLPRDKHWSRLTPDDIRKIRERLAAGELQATIAADFGVGFKAISKIKLGQRWNHVQ